MKPFIILITYFVCYSLFSYLVEGSADIAKSGRMAMGFMLLFTAIGHFKFKKGMVMMLPSFIPIKAFIIMATGVLEILFAVAVNIPSLQIISGWLLIVMFVAFLPANIYAALKHIDYEKGTYDGKGLSYLWFRVPFQLFLIVWTWFFIIHPSQ